MRAWMVVVAVVAMLAACGDDPGAGSVGGSGADAGTAGGDAFGADAVEGQGDSGSADAGTGPVADIEEFGRWTAQNHPLIGERCPVDGSVCLPQAGADWASDMGRGGYLICNTSDTCASCVADSECGERTSCVDGVCIDSDTWRPATQLQCFDATDCGAFLTCRGAGEFRRCGYCETDSDCVPGRICALGRICLTPEQDAQH